jgi:hypothetical protein
VHALRSSMLHGLPMCDGVVIGNSICFTLQENSGGWLCITTLGGEVVRIILAQLLSRKAQVISGYQAQDPGEISNRLGLSASTSLSLGHPMLHLKRKLYSSYL